MRPTLPLIVLPRLTARSPMTTSAKPYRVTVTWHPDISIATLLTRAPSGTMRMSRYTLTEIEMLTGERPFPPQGLRRVVRQILRPLLRVRGPSVPGPWAERDSAVVQQKIERWGRRAGIEWAREHALKWHQSVLDDDDIVFECIVREGISVGRDLSE